MTDLDAPGLDDADQPIDGRVARRQRNVDAVLDVVLELFAEESLFPTIEQAATRSGLSLRSLYRYFADPGQLLEATIKRSRQRSAEISRLPAIGQGVLSTRIDDFVAVRLRVYDEFGPMFRATIANAAQNQPISAELARTRDELREQFERQFRPELDARGVEEREAVLSAGDLLTQLDSVDHLRRHRGLSATATTAVLSSTLHTLLA